MALLCNTVGNKICLITKPLNIPVCISYSIRRPIRVPTIQLILFFLALQEYFLKNTLYLVNILNPTQFTKTVQPDIISIKVLALLQKIRQMAVTNRTVLYIYFPTNPVFLQSTTGMYNGLARWRYAATGLARSSSSLLKTSSKRRYR
jgi:hypothetical protein